MVRLAEELKQPSQEWFARVYQALVALLEGEFGEAERLIFAARELGARAQSWNAAVSFGLQLYVLRRAGPRGRARGARRQSLADYPTYPIWRCVEAHLAARLGHDDAHARSTPCPPTISRAARSTRNGSSR